MAKCTVCNSRKGKRKCKKTGVFICSLCCGETREPEECAGCSFVVPSVANRKYRSVPYYSTEEMANSLELQGIAENIESLLCMIWAADPERVNDWTVTRLVEKMMDHYYFNNESPSFTEMARASDTPLPVRAICEELEAVPVDMLVKVLAAVHRAIQRRSIGGNSYLEFVSRFTQIGPK